MTRFQTFYEFIIIKHDTMFINFDSTMQHSCLFDCNSYITVLFNISEFTNKMKSIILTQSVQ